MAYCTVSDIKGKIDNDELIRLTDETGDGTVDDAKIQEAINEAAAEVDSYCARLYTVPFPDPVPDMISKVAKDIAVYNVYSLKHAAPEDCDTRYKRAVAYLDRVSKGTVELGAGAPAETDDGGPEVIRTADSKTFSLERMEGFLKTLIQKSQAALRTGLIYVRGSDVFVTAHENHIPRGTKFPAIGIKDGDIDREDLAGGESQDQELSIRFILFVKQYSGAKTIMGEGNTKGILDFADDVHRILKDNDLGIPGVQHVAQGKDQASVSFGVPDDGIQQKILTYTYEIRR